MNTVRPYLTKWLMLLGLALTVVGCPNARLVIVTSTDVLDFGENKTELAFLVTKSNTSREMPPLVVVGGESWLTVLDCTSAEDDCVSANSADAILVRVRVDRSKMDPGVNTSVLRLDVQGSPSEFVDVVAESTIVPDFTVTDRTPLTFQEVTFADNSRLSPGWEITDWFWNFSRGRTSTLQNPAPFTFTEGGPRTISLTITATNGVETITRTTRRVDYVIVSDRIAPDAEFDVSTTEPLVFNPVFFTDLSVPGTAAITTWEWNFGDGATSREQNPSHAYHLGGTYTVSLKVVSGDGFDIETKTDLITVIVTPPTANFTADDTNPPIGTPVQFTDISDDGSSPITSWDWSFGDGGISTEENPVHVFTEAGTYTIRLTATSLHGSDTEIKNNFIVARLVAPEADFTSNTQRPLVGDAIQFTDLSDPGTSPDIAEYLWDFGDGTTSSDANPTHVYATTGTFDVSLTVVARDGSDAIFRDDYLSVFDGTGLDSFVRDDTGFSYELIDSVPDPNNIFTLHSFELVSQTWRSPAEVDRTEWRHTVQIIEPTVTTHSRAMLLIDGGSNPATPPTAADPQLAALAVSSQSIIAIIRQVPNQPLTFTGETESRTEDALIAYSFAQFLDSFEGGNPDNEWPALLPMTRSAVRALDLIQDFFATRETNPRTIEDFVVTGASKRGWTTWLTGAVDPRVVAIAPIVIDFLNFVPQIENQFNTYGFFTEAVFDYVEAGIFFVDNGTLVNRFDSPAGAALREMVDPYEYRSRFANVPKLLINATGDQFFTPDSSQFYFDDLPGEKKLSYIPNDDHNVDTAAVGESLAPWYVAVLNDETLPQFLWEVSPGGQQLTATPDDPASAATMFLASTPTRDFRFDANVNPLVPMWNPIALNLNANDQYLAQARDLPGRWNGFLIQLEFENPSTAPGAMSPFVFSTSVRISPDTFPMISYTLPAAAFTVSPSPSVSANDPVTFTDTSQAGSGPIIRRVWDLGNGMTSSDELVTTTYAPGTYTVSLTVTTVHGSDTETKSNFMQVSAK